MHGLGLGTASMNQTAKDLKEFIPAPLWATTGVEKQVCASKGRKDNGKNQLGSATTEGSSLDQHNF